MAAGEGITVRYVYSACIVTRTPDVAILHDPWFTEGAYDGAWFHFPAVADPLASTGDADLVFASHIHPDHYDPAFLRAWFARYGRKDILVADREPNFLARKMRQDGFAPRVLAEPLRIGRTTIRIVPHETGSASDVDSALVLQYRASDRTHCVINANDIAFDPAMAERLRAAAGGEVDVLLCGHTGAGPYPQTYFDLDDPRLPAEAERKKQAFFGRYRAMTAAIGAKVDVPFAGKYLLGGRLAPLNPFRGVADPVEAAALDPRAVVLADDGGEIDTATLVPRGVRTGPYPAEAVARRVAEIAGERMDYERLIAPEEIGQLPLRRLLAMAAPGAVRRSEVRDDYFFCIGLPDGSVAILGARQGGDGAVRFAAAGVALPSPRSELRIDPRYLFGLLTTVYHWNNAEIGSQYQVRRHPNVFVREAQAFLNFLHV